MIQRNVRIAILGCGKVAHLHAKAISNLPNAELAAVWSRTKSNAETFAELYDTSAYEDIEEMVNRADIDLVIICTPHPFHKEPAIIAAKAGANVLVEKPLAATLDDCDAIISVCNETGVKLGVVSQRRWYAPAMRIKNAIESNKIGTPIIGSVVMYGWRDKDYYEADAWRGTWEMEGGGVLVNQAPHQLDLLLWYMGEIQEVYGLWRNFNHPYIDVDDTALAIIKFKNGGVGNIIVSNSQKPGLYGKVHIHGNNGASVGIQTDGGAMFIAGTSKVSEPPVNDLWTVPNEESMINKWKKYDAELFRKIDSTTFYIERQLEDFMNAIASDEEPLVTGLDGRRTVELFTAIYRSSRDNAPISFPILSEKNNDMDGRLKS